MDQSKMSNLDEVDNYLKSIESKIKGYENEMIAQKSEIAFTQDRINEIEKEFIEEHGIDISKADEHLATIYTEIQSLMAQIKSAVVDLESKKSE